MNISKIIFLFLLFISCDKEDKLDSNEQTEEFTMATFDENLNAPFGTLAYRVYYPIELTAETYAIILSRGGNGQGDDRGALQSYAQNLVSIGYVVIQIDHRNAGANIENIAVLRGEEIQFLSEQIAENGVDYGNFSGTVNGLKQGYIGHSAGAMEGLLSAGMDMTHGNYLCPAIKAVYAMSPPGYSPDQFGIKQSPNGFTTIDETALVMIVGEDEKDRNGMGTINEEDWRLQGYDQMNENGLRIQVLVKGINTGHNDVAGLNGEIKLFNERNSIVLFDTFLREQDKLDDITNLALPTNNELEIRKKGD